mgnify:CR=1 FL=1
MNFIRQEKSNRLVLKKYKGLAGNKRYHQFAKLLIDLGGYNINIYNSALPKDIDRIISVDVERSVNHNKSKSQVRYILTQLYYYYNDYNQGLAYIATFLSCFVHKDVVVNVMRDVLVEKMHRNVWKTSLIHLREEMHVLEQICGEGVLEGMSKSDMHFQFFLQKYVFTMFINVFSEEYLLEYFKNFLTRENYHYLVISSIMKQVYIEKNYDDESLGKICVMMGVMSNLPESIQKRSLEDAKFNYISSDRVRNWIDEGRLIAETKIVIIDDDGNTEDEISLYSDDSEEDCDIV